MNPVDHPMGGGEGRASGGHPRSRKVYLPKDTRHVQKRIILTYTLSKDVRNNNKLWLDH